MYRAGFYFAVLCVCDASQDGGDDCNSNLTTVALVVITSLYTLRQSGMVNNGTIQCDPTTRDR